MSFKRYLQHLFIGLGVYVFLFAALLLYVQISGRQLILDNTHFLRFDAELYQQIRNQGYFEDWLCAFFPAFPFTWKLLGLSPVGISLFNGLIFLLSSSALASVFNFQPLKQVLFLTIPSLLFMFVPYSESLFFLACTLLLIGLKTDRGALVLGGLFLGSLIRPTTFIFIPAIAGTYFMCSSSFKQALKKAIPAVACLVIGLGVTVCIHYAYTGKWLIFFEAQKLWKNYLHFPKLPFNSWGGDGVTRYDGSVLVVFIACTLFIVPGFFKERGDGRFSPALSFSLLYIIGTSLLILAYRDGNLYSLNRFVYATPFIMVAMDHFLCSYKFQWKQFWLMILCTEILWLCFNSYNHIHNFLMFTAVSVYFALLMLCGHQNRMIALSSTVLLTVINSIGIVKLFYRFLNGGWIA